MHTCTSFIWTDDSVLVCLCLSVIRNELKLVYNLFVWHVAVVVCHSQPFLLCWNGESAHIIQVRWCRESTRKRLDFPFGRSQCIMYPVLSNPMLTPLDIQAVRSPWLQIALRWLLLSGRGTRLSHKSCSIIRTNPANLFGQRLTATQYLLKHTVTLAQISINEPAYLESVIITCQSYLVFHELHPLALTPT